MSDDRAQDRATTERRVAWRSDLNKVAARVDFAAWIFALTGLVMMLSRQFLNVDYGAYRPLGSLCLAGALACWAVVFVKRRAWIKANPLRD